MQAPRTQRGSLPGRAGWRAVSPSGDLDRLAPDPARRRGRTPSPPQRRPAPRPRTPRPRPGRSDRRPGRPRPGPARRPAAQSSPARATTTPAAVPVQPERLRGDTDHVRLAVQQDQPVALQPRLVAHVVAGRRREVQAREALAPPGPAELPHRPRRLERPVPPLPQGKPATLTRLDEAQLELRPHGIAVRPCSNPHRFPRPRSRSGGRYLLVVKIAWRTVKATCQRSPTERSPYLH